MNRPMSYSSLVIDLRGPKNAAAESKTSVDRGMILQEARQLRADVLVQQLDADHHPDPARGGGLGFRFALAVAGQLAHRLAERGKVAKEGGPFGRQLRPSARVARQEPCSELLLKGFQLVGDCSLRNPQLFAGEAKAPQIAEKLEYFQLAQGER